MADPIPTIGRIVHYRLSNEDVDAISRRRTTGRAIADRLKAGLWHRGAQAHIGNDAKPGMVCPMIITKVVSRTVDSAINGQVFLDGSDVLWVINVHLGGMPGTYMWPVMNAEINRG